MNKRCWVCSGTASPGGHCSSWRSCPVWLPSADDSYYKQIAGEKREALKGRFAQLKDEAKQIVPILHSTHTLAQSTTTFAVSQVAAVVC